MLCCETRSPNDMLRPELILRPTYIRVHSQDNVGVVVDPEGLAAGADVSQGLKATEHIPQAQKIALRDFAQGDPIHRYGQPIGTTTRAIKAGSWVRNDAVRLPVAPPLQHLPLATATPKAQEPLTGYTFEGFRSGDGQAGTKNILGITTTVQCVAPTVDYAVRRIKQEILPHFSNVDDVIAVTHNYGCGVAINAPGAEIPINTIRHISTHANLGASPLIVSLGCEKLQPDRLFSDASGGVLPVLQQADS